MPLISKKQPFFGNSSNKNSKKLPKIGKKHAKIEKNCIFNSFFDLKICFFPKNDLSLHRFSNQTLTKTHDKMALIIYLTGVIVSLCVCCKLIHDNQELRLSDILSTLVLTLLSWGSIVFLITETVTSIMQKKDIDIIIWRKKEK